MHCHSDLAADPSCSLGVWWLITCVAQQLCLTWSHTYVGGFVTSLLVVQVTHQAEQKCVRTRL